MILRLQRVLDSDYAHYKSLKLIWPKFLIGVDSAFNPSST